MGELNHYLITIALLSPPGMHVHGYLMCEGNQTEGLMNKMLYEIEKLNFQPLEIILSTELSTSVELVRDILGNNPGVKQAMDTATDFHVTIVVMPRDCEWDKQLMELH